MTTRFNMLGLLKFATQRYARLLAGCIAPRPRGNGAPLSLRRAVLMLLFVPLLLAVQLIHWLGLLLDELLFPGYRRITIREPVFIVGVPRSGTTALHRTLAQDPQFTTFSTWECLLALSITERKFWLALAGLDRRLGGPGQALLQWLQGRLFGQLEAVHPTDLQAPEEDYLALTPILACFVFVLPFPWSGDLWRTGSFDRDASPAEKQRIMAFYRACLQRHLYVHGADKRLLSKNASFSPMVATLAKTFPDARFICCMRDPQKTVPSQLSSVAGGLRSFGADPDIVFPHLIDQLAYYYDHLLAVLPNLPSHQHAFIDAPRLRAAMAATITATYARLDLTLTPEYQATLDSADQDSKAFVTRHRYSLEQFGWDAERLRQRFDHVYRHYEFGHA
mgnify:CR=1 FL=1